MAILQGRIGAYVYGLSLQGRIIMNDGAFIRGVNGDDEADVYTSFAGAGTTDTCRMDGSSSIGGKLFVTDPRDVYTQCNFRGNPTIAGKDLWTGPTYIWDMVYTSSPTAEFPTIDLTQLTSMATTPVTRVEPYVDPTTGRWVTSFENVRILANANPIVSRYVQLTGVVYVEAPNVVRFDNGAQITGVIVTADGSDNWASTCRLEFDGSFELKGVDQLPADAKWDTLRAQSGSSIVAPGFTVGFSSGDSRADGVIACQGFTLSRRATLSVKGGILVYGDGNRHAGPQDRALRRQGRPDRRPRRLRGRHEVQRRRQLLPRTLSRLAHSPPRAPPEPVLSPKGEGPDLPRAGRDPRLLIPPRPPFPVQYGDTPTPGASPDPLLPQPARPAAHAGRRPRVDPLAGLGVEALPRRLARRARPATRPAGRPADPQGRRSDGGAVRTPCRPRPDALLAAVGLRRARPPRPRRTRRSRRTCGRSRSSSSPGSRRSGRCSRAR